MSKLIVILGITGTQGSSVATTFQALPGWRIRGVTRNPSSSTSQTLSKQGIEIVQGDLDSPPSLLSAFRGAHAIFAVTDFWAPVFSAEGQAAAQAAGKIVTAYAFEREIQLGKNIANAAADPGTLETLERFVFSSLSDAGRWSGAKYTGVYHFEGKAKVVQYVRESLPKLAERMSTVQIGEYANNWRQFSILAPRKQPDGSFVIDRPHSGKAPIPFVVTNKDTGAFVKALVESPPGISLLGYGSMMGWEEFAEVWGRLLGVKAIFKQIPEHEYLVGVPEDVAREVREGHLYQAEFGWDGGDPSIVHPKDMKVHVPVTTIEEYIRGEDWSSIL